MCKLSIVTHLTEAGYKPELDYVDRFWLQDRLGASFREPKPLTQKSEYVVESLEIGIHLLVTSVGSYAPRFDHSAR